VVIKSNSTVQKEKITSVTKIFLLSYVQNFSPQVIPLEKYDEKCDEVIFLKKNVNSITICDDDVSPPTNGNLSIDQVDLDIQSFKNNEEGDADEITEGEEDLPAYKEWILPNIEFQDVWESLIFEHGVKSNLLDYAFTTMLFSDKQVKSSLINWNRVLLLHGPPGTGKTSLCKSLAQKLSIRLSHRYKSSVLIEINSHSLFSKWFSESGKLVMKLFSKIHELVDDEKTFVCVLIDEVESLSAARKSALSGSEPSDSIRVVNALLTQIDSLKKCKNVLILTTSNITQAIDLAFVDRADVKLYIGNPSHEAIYHILRSCILELQRVGIIIGDDQIPTWNDSTAKSNRLSISLFKISDQCKSFSGRFLKKLPFLAHASYVKKNTCDMYKFLDALEKTIIAEQISRKTLE
jgi:Cdc6-like AAA superfamily ATPase